MMAKKFFDSKLAARCADEKTGAILAQLRPLLDANAEHVRPTAAHRTPQAATAWSESIH
jgi:hypothetical protein